MFINNCSFRDWTSLMNDNTRFSSEPLINGNHWLTLIFLSRFFRRIVSSTETNKAHRSNVQNINPFKVLNIPIINPFWLIFEWNSNQVFMRKFDQFSSLLNVIFRSRGTLSYGKFNHEVYKRGEFSMFYSLKNSSWWKCFFRLQTTWKSSFVWNWFESDRSTTCTRSAEKCRLCFAINSSLIFVTFNYFSADSITLKLQIYINVFFSPLFLIILHEYIFLIDSLWK